MFLKTLSITFLIASASLFVLGQTSASVNDFGAISNDEADDTAMIQAATDYVLRNGGGSVIFGPGTYRVNGRINVVPEKLGIDVSFKGEGVAAIRVGAGAGTIVFYAGNLNQLNFTDLTFVGRNVPSGHPDFIDVGHLIYVNYVLALNVVRCNFFGIAAMNGDFDAGSLIFIGAADANIRDSNFNGSFAPYPNGSLIESRNSNGLSISNSRFLDYANYDGGYFSKTTAFVGAWVRVSNSESWDASQQKSLNIKDSFFDEGAQIAVDVSRVPQVKISGLSVNVNGSTAGTGIRLNRVEFAEVSRSVFGMAKLPRPAIETITVKGLKVTSLRFNEGVFFLLNNGLESSQVEFCQQCKRIARSSL